jgi:hypothetical protein
VEPTNAPLSFFNVSNPYQFSENGVMVQRNGQLDSSMFSVTMNMYPSSLNSQGGLDRDNNLTATEMVDDDFAVSVVCHQSDFHVQRLGVEHKFAIQNEHGVQN